MAEQFYDSRTSPARWRALDPSTARTGLAHSTLYVPDRLLVAGDDRDATGDFIDGGADDGIAGRGVE